MKARVPALATVLGGAWSMILLGNWFSPGLGPQKENTSASQDLPELLGAQLG